jgi:peptidoglycan hydrolase-like protein with peptidoglycan-binding domain
MCRDWQCQDPAIVKRLQEALRDKGENLKPDGSFGKITQAALDSFAQKNGLTETRPRNDPLLQKLFVGRDYETIRKRVYAACVY